MGEELAAVETRVGAAQRQLARLEASANDPGAAGNALALRGEEEGEEGEEGLGGEEGEGDSWLQGALLRRNEAARRLQALAPAYLHTSSLPPLGSSPPSLSSPAPPLSSPAPSLSSAPPSLSSAPPPLRLTSSASTRCAWGSSWA